MINDSKIKKISLVITVIGLVMIYAASTYTTNVMQIKDITRSSQGQIIGINGTVTSFSTTNGNIFMNVDDGSGNMTVVMFERTARNQDIYKLKEGDNIEVHGQVNVYKNELEIIANSVSIDFS